MKKIIIIIIIIFISLNLTFLLFAENIVLKTGRTVEARIMEKNNNSIKVDLYGVPVTYYFDEIASIDGQAVGEISANISLDLSQQENTQDQVYSKKNVPELSVDEQIIFSFKENSVIYTNFNYFFTIMLPLEWKSFYKKDASGKKLYIGNHGDAIVFSPENDTSAFVHILMERRHPDIESITKEQVNIILNEPEAEIISYPVDTEIWGMHAKKLVFSDRYSKKAIRYIIFNSDAKITSMLTFNFKTMDAYNRYITELEKVLGATMPGIGIQIMGF
ncbi:MAG: hypothetical protein PHP69_02910 [Candidatus Omnitrophica bacterium]|nr:hypothetical protein [Candidatus Omnitrophota bacterium]MDD5080785.1 hypothetical protein [Candidatus Omnitrophota bacterium]MDD5440867.1 hypothetical protein [Candidatus Omnitrophota bacterium]